MQTVCDVIEFAIRKPFSLGILKIFCKKSRTHTIPLPQTFIFNIFNFLNLEKTHLRLGTRRRRGRGGDLAFPSL